ncbi:hypothetical protein [Calidithermus chliarophilus]|uniref:hypothetical protein n=1 Tax=Calidithermus chliarophilus TaxID=52023 RepID=UPI0004894869|nr:hypothetical protein [Calidithermus chliarophilus]
MLWLGPRQGYLSDWVTQRWVQLTGKRVDLEREPWLEGPVGKTTGIGPQFFEELAAESGLLVQRQPPNSGLIEDFGRLASAEFSPEKVSPQIIDFYEHTSNYELDAWAEWNGLFRPLGRALAGLFSRRLQQLNVPLTGLDTSLGVTSEVVRLVEPYTGRVRYTAWVRQLRSNNHVLYAGTYSVCKIPGQEGACVKVVFPLPNGNAVVVMKPKAHDDGSFSITSSGKGFGDAGFYFTVRDRGSRFWVRYVPTMRETIRVYPSGADVRADHEFRIWGQVFLRLHYRLRPRKSPSTATSADGVLSPSRPGTA